MKKIYALFLFGWFISAGFSQQQILLLSETFNFPTNGMTINASGVGNNSGSNQWIVSNDYNGGGPYPNTPNEDSVVSGTINGAPLSKYLHIHDAASGINNANWNTNTASDRFAYIGSPFCTLGLTDVKFSFFWICEGDSTAYGEIYYRVNGGAWVQTGQTKYNNQSKWKYETVQDPAFNNVLDLQLGFRWVNPASGVSPNVSFGIDDIFAVGTYDEILNANNLQITVGQNEICQGQPILCQLIIDPPLCDANYYIQMSNAGGSFANPFNLGFLSLGPNNSQITFLTLPTPGNVQGTCFHIRIVRNSPPPVIISDTSLCVKIDVCPNSILNLTAAVMMDADTTCIESVIDVKFNSIGVFGSNNNYIAELSDSTGNFADSIKLGNLAVHDSFPPPSPPKPKGNVAGLIPPTVPPGCGYYIRIRSTNPPAISAPIGPYCLVHCDELTNNHTDLKYCINSTFYPPSSDTIPQCERFEIEPHHWDSLSVYDTCNDWKIELRKMDDFSLVNSGGLGIYHDTAGRVFQLCMPLSADSLPPGVGPGSYYLRIVSDCSNLTWNQTGTVIRITIGAPDPQPAVLLPPDSVYCVSEIASVTAVPWHTNSNGDTSKYLWYSNLFNGPFIWPYNPLFISFNPNTLAGDYPIYVREINNGCIGPYSAKANISVITRPTAKISGDTVVCFGDTVPYHVSFLRETYYEWHAPPGLTVLDASNSEATFILDSIGTYTISSYNVNKCGQDSGFYTINVVSPYHIDAGPDTSLCERHPVSLTGEIPPLNKVFTTKDTVTSQSQQGAMFNIIAHGDVVIDSFAVKYFGTPSSIQQEIWGKPGSYRTFEQTAGVWSLIGAYNNFAPAPSGQFTVIPIQVNQPISKGDTFAFYVTTVNTPAVNMRYVPGLGVLHEAVYKTDGVIDFAQGTVNAYAFGAFSGPRVLILQIYYSTKAGLKFLWNTGDTTETVVFNPQQTTDYIVKVYDTSGCKSLDTVRVNLIPSPLVKLRSDTTLCAGEPVNLDGSTSEQNFNWKPVEGLSDTSILNPVADDYQTTQYILSSKGPNGCIGSDSILITVIPLPAVNAGPDTFLCNGSNYIIPATSSVQDVEWTPSAGLDNPLTVNPVFNGTQTSVYVLQANDNTTGCKGSDTLTIGVGKAPALDAGPDKELCDGEPYTLTATSDGKRFVWSPATALSDSTSLNPVFSGETDSAETKYILMAFDSVGCSSSDTLKLTVAGCYLKVPQAFTPSPNGDGINDHFTVFGSVEKYEIKIFNRWGEMVYHSSDPTELSDKNRGWDGTYKGKLQETGTFVYYITAVDHSGKTIPAKKGNLTLIR